MTDSLPSSVLALHTLRNLRAGDLVWVTVNDSVETEEVEMIQEMIGSYLVDDVNIMVTHKSYMEQLKTVGLKELAQLHEVIEAVMRDKMAQNTVES